MFELELFILSTQQADFLLSFGSTVGFYKSIIQAYDGRTVITRKATFPDTSLYLLTAVWPMWSMGLYFTAAVWTLNFGLKLWVYLFRAPENEDWKGNISINYLKKKVKSWY